jgi:primase-polymerase (primpol)-like protein
MVAGRRSGLNTRSWKMTKEDRIAREVKNRLIKEAYSRVEALKAEGYDLEGCSSRLKQWLEEHEEVKEVMMVYKTDLTVKFVDGTQVGILLGREHLYGRE